MRRSLFLLPLSLLLAHGGAACTADVAPAAHDARPAADERAVVSTRPAALKIGASIPVPTGSTGFGRWVALEGDNLAVRDSSNVYVYHWDGGAWTLEGKFPRGTGSNKAPLEGLSGDTLLVTPDVRVRDANGKWNLQATLPLNPSGPPPVPPPSFYATAAAIRGDRVLVCGYTTSAPGTVPGKVFTRSGSTWTASGTFSCTAGGLVKPTNAVAAVLDGQDFVVAATTGPSAPMDFTPDTAVHAFADDAGAWTASLVPHPADQSDEQFGSGAWNNADFFGRIALVDGLLVVGDPADGVRSSYGFDGPGVVRAFRRDASGVFAPAWAMFGNWRDDHFGNQLALSKDVLVVSAMRTDASTDARVYRNTPTGVELHGRLAGSPRAASGTRVVMQEGFSPWSSNFGAPLSVYDLLQSNGSACANGAECASGFCADGVCCDTACGGGDPSDCSACSVAAGAASDGTCGVASQGTVCRAARDACDVAETCDGASTACPAVDAVVPDGASCSGDGVCSQGACKVALGGVGEDAIVVPAAFSQNAPGDPATRAAATRNRLVTPSTTGFEVFDVAPSGWHRAADTRLATPLAAQVLAVEGDVVLMTHFADSGFGTVFRFEASSAGWALVKEDDGSSANGGFDAYPDSRWGAALGLRGGSAYAGDPAHTNQPYENTGFINGPAFSGNIKGGGFGSELALDPTSTRLLAYETGTAVIFDGTRKTVAVNHGCATLRGALSIQGDWAAVCENVLHRDAAGVWSVVQTLPYKATVGIDAGRLLSGTHVFELQGSTWVETATLQIRSPRAGASLLEDSIFVGGRAFVRGTYEGKTAYYVYTLGNKAAQGATCDGNGACQSGYCVDGVCCDVACGGGSGGDCVACSVAAGAAADGTCGPVADGSVCGGTGTCTAGSCSGGSGGSGGGGAGGAGGAGAGGQAGEGGVGSAGGAGAGGQAGEGGVGGAGASGSGGAGEGGSAGAGASGSGGAGASAGAGGSGGAGAGAGAGGSVGGAGAGASGSGGAGAGGSAGAGAGGSAGAGAGGSAGAGASGSAGAGAGTGGTGASGGGTGGTGVGGSAGVGGTGAAGGAGGSAGAGGSGAAAGQAGAAGVGGSTGGNAGAGGAGKAGGAGAAGGSAGGTASGGKAGASAGAGASGAGNAGKGAAVDAVAEGELEGGCSVGPRVTGSAAPLWSVLVGLVLLRRRRQGNQRP